MEEEIWRRVPGEPLEVSNLGNVISLAYGRQRPLRSMFNGSGYKQVGWRRDGKRRSTTVHRLVLLAFEGPPPAGMVARHLNGVRADNRLANLKWGTYAENSADAWKHLQDRRHRGAGRGPQKLCVQSVKEIRKRAANGESMRKLGRVYGVSSVTIVHVVNRQTWAWVGTPGTERK